MATTRGERLKFARRQLFSSARSAAASLGMPPATYGAHERAEAPNGRDYGPDEAIQYGRHFNVSPEWLLTGRGESRPESLDFPGLSEPENRLYESDDIDVIFQRLIALTHNAKNDAGSLRSLLDGLRRADFSTRKTSRKNSASILRGIQRLIDSLEASGGLTFSLASELEHMIQAKGASQKPLSGIESLLRKFTSGRRPSNKKK